MENPELTAFREKFRVAELCVVETEHWAWSVRPAQPTLGATVLSLRRGASAYVLKTVDPTDLPSTLRQVIGGTVFSTVGATEASTPSGAKAAGLTDREIAILTELASGKSNDEIAKELWVTQQTVKFHLTNVYRKLGAKNRADAVRQAYQLGLIQRPLGDD